MADGATVPPSVFSKYSARVIAASLVERFHERNEAHGAARPAYDYMRDTMIQMRFKQEYIGSIITRGFLNQHITGTTQGYKGGETRAQVEDDLIGVHLESTYQGGNDAVNTVRPKYAFLAFPADDSDGDYASQFLSAYGSVIAVFKSSVKSRATFTSADSLNRDTDDSISLTPGAIRAHSFFDRPAAAVPRFAGDDNYWEAQIWGPLTIQDVAYFLVNCDGEEAITDENLTLLKTTKIPVFNCVIADDKSHFAKGDPVP